MGSLSFENDLIDVCHSFWPHVDLSSLIFFNFEEAVMIKLDFEKCGGMIPAIAQNADTGEVLMLAYINPQSWE